MTPEKFSRPSFTRLLQISRPRFWIYLLGPLLVGTAAAWPVELSAAETVLLLMLFLYFTWPANFLIYGINDMFDWETDRLNAKKQGYELLLPKAEHRAVSMVSLLTTLPVIAMTFAVSQPTGWCLIGFIFLGIFYSAPPIRAKTKPGFDSVFNGLYIFPGLTGFVLLAQHLPAWPLIIAAWLWSMAMHAYSAVPDIQSDAQAGLRTIATTFQQSGTLAICMTCYVVAAILAYPWLSWFAILSGGVYFTLMVVSLPLRSEQLLEVYRWFPPVNTGIGFGLFCLAVFS